MSGNGLLGSTVLDVAIGLVFVYLLLAIVCTTVNEWIAGIFQTRSKTLTMAIKQLLDTQAGQAGSTDLDWFVKQFYAHPLIAGMKQPGPDPSHPAYIPAAAFAATVIDITTAQKAGVISFADLETGINNLPPGDVKKALLSLIQNANGSLAVSERNIEAWFNDTMDRVSGWYKRRTQVWTVILAAMLTLGANADTMRIARRLWTSPTLRAQIVALAPDQKNATTPASQRELDELGTVIGWSKQDFNPMPDGFRPWLAWSAQRLIGWILSIVAISLGAPFWFDLLNKFMRIRNAGEVPDPTSKVS